MKLTKYEHACIVLEDSGKKVVIDPGEFTASFGPVDNVAAVVVTHAHGDHYKPEHLHKILAANPDVKVFTTDETAKQWGDPHAVTVTGGQTQEVGPFKLQFFGELHQEIHPMAPRIQNLGVLVNDMFYFPGDSFVLPEGASEIKLLAVPACAPWMRTGEAIDFMKAVMPKRFMRTHDGMLNDRGLKSNDAWFNMASKNFGPAYEPLEPGESTEI